MLPIVDAFAEVVGASANDCVPFVVVVAVVVIAVVVVAGAVVAGAVVAGAVSSSTFGGDLGSAMGSFGFPGVNFDTASDVVGKGNDAEDIKCKTARHFW